MTTTKVSGEAQVNPPARRNLLTDTEIRGGD